MKKFALLVMLLTASALTVGCGEKKKEPAKEPAAAGATEGGEKTPAKDAEPAK